jgi:hypothetical protein
MADTYTIVLDQRNAQAQQLGNSNFGVISGIITITSYATAKVAYAEIAGAFKVVTRVVTDGVSSAGFHTRWDPVTGTIRAYVSANGAVDTQASVGSGLGAIGFIAIGQLG